MRHALNLLIIAILGVILLYLSRFWIFSFWGREGLLGIAELRPQGGLLAVWLRGTALAPFELLIWALGSFLILTGVQKVFDAVSLPPDTASEDSPDDGST